MRRRYTEVIHAVWVRLIRFNVTLSRLLAAPSHVVKRCVDLTHVLKASFSLYEQSVKAVHTKLDPGSRRGGLGLGGTRELRSWSRAYAGAGTAGARAHGRGRPAMGGGAVYSAEQPAGCARVAALGIIGKWTAAPLVGAHSAGIQARRKQGRAWPFGDGPVGMVAHAKRNTLRLKPGPQMPVSWSLRGMSERAGIRGCCLCNKANSGPCSWLRVALLSALISVAPCPHAHRAGYGRSPLGAEHQACGGVVFTLRLAG